MKHANSQNPLGAGAPSVGGPGPDGPAQQKGAVAMDVDYVFAGLVVQNRDKAAAWYQRLFGRPPDLLPERSGSPLAANRHGVALPGG